MVSWMCALYCGLRMLSVVGCYKSGVTCSLATDPEEPETAMGRDYVFLWFRVPIKTENSNSVSPIRDRSID